jgi:enoyl-[acyl-carrier-protein] reductase (NADH)
MRAKVHYRIDRLRYAARGRKRCQRINHPGRHGRRPRNLAVEWGPRNVRVNAIAPGIIKTDFARALWENEELMKCRNAQTPLRRIGLPGEIGPIAAFLASPAASFITGQTIVANGGITIA